MKSRNTILGRVLALLLAVGGLLLLILRIPPVVLTWETASEVGTAGFNVYRQTSDGEDELVQVNDVLIEAQGDELTGASYRFEDEEVRAGQQYLYRIEEVEWGGNASLFPNTVSVRAGLPSVWVKAEGAILLVIAGFLLWRSFQKTMTVPLDFSIGDIAFTVDGPQEWLDAIRAKWGMWCEPGGPTMAVHLEFDETLEVPDGSLFETLPQCNAGECVMQTPAFDGKISVANAEAHMRFHPDATIQDAVYFLRIAMAVWAFHNGAVLFHSATVVHNERAYAFFGLSGSGKTTTAKLSAPDPVLSDDLVLVHPREEWIDVYATPFSKKRGDVMHARLAALLRLIKAPDVALVPLSPAQAMGELVANSPVIAGDGACLPLLMQRWQDVMQRVPVKKLHFRKEPSFWEVIDAELG